MPEMPEPIMRTSKFASLEDVWPFMAGRGYADVAGIRRRYARGRIIESGDGRIEEMLNRVIVIEVRGLPFS
jgi:hypothetical protein